MATPGALINDVAAERSFVPIGDAMNLLFCHNSVRSSEKAASRAMVLITQLKRILQGRETFQ
jgi:hypothetical protein